MVDMLNSERGPIQVLFGDDAVGNPMVVVPIVFAAFVILIILAFRIISKDKGKSEMTEEELAKDRDLFDERMKLEAVHRGETYLPEVARAVEAKEIAEAKRRYGRE